MMNTLQLLTLLVSAASSPEGAEARHPDQWAGTVGLAFIYLQGSASTVTLNGTANLGRTWNGWSLDVRAGGAYGETRAASEGPPVLAALAGRAGVRGARDLTRTMSVFLGTAAETDHVKSLELRALWEGGAANEWWSVMEGDHQKVLLRSDLSILYGRELQYQYVPTPEDLPDRELLGPKLALIFRYALGRDVVLSEEADVLPSVLDEFRALVSSRSKITAKLIAGLALGVAFELNYDSAPAVGKPRTDTALTVGVELAI